VYDYAAIPIRRITGLTRLCLFYPVLRIPKSNSKKGHSQNWRERSLVCQFSV